MDKTEFTERWNRVREAFNAAVLAAEAGDEEAEDAQFDLLRQFANMQVEASNADFEVVYDDEHNLIDLIPLE